MRQILADYDDEGIHVYQAFKQSTVAAALAAGTFSTGFSLDRMSWIKPSFGWMLYRSGYATKPRQEGILRIKLSHGAFAEILAQAVLSHFVPELHSDRVEWKRSVNRSQVRVQWDPDRDLRLVKLDHRAIQIGLRGEAIRRYVSEWIIGLEEVTALAREVHAAVQGRSALPAVPQERVYPVDDAGVRERLGIDE